MMLPAGTFECPLTKPVSFAVQPTIDAGSPSVEPAVDAVTPTIESTVEPVAPAIETLFDAVPLPFQALG